MIENMNNEYSLNNPPLKDLNASNMGIVIEKIVSKDASEVTDFANVVETEKKSQFIVVANCKHTEISKLAEEALIEIFTNLESMYKPSGGEIVRYVDEYGQMTQDLIKLIEEKMLAKMGVSSLAEIPNNDEFEFSVGGAAKIGEHVFLANMGGADILLVRPSMEGTIEAVDLFAESKKFSQKVNLAGEISNLNVQVHNFRIKPGAPTLNLVGFTEGMRNCFSDSEEMMEFTGKMFNDGAEHLQTILPSVINGILNSEKGDGTNDISAAVISL